ncbi:Hypothetical predicted protein [Mytilus galloprovincialis]|uniref:Reverse transcriptase domain-containing protein n=1 Tax=Mytilus galloprovincialis TaxID=29158 RepID=A0A8B6D5X2_MYTGA|nr:Hypothetical predicted protein [Mytilus galloprovincialis]
MACHPEIPVGGRLIYFLKKWEQITDDQWVLSVIKEGYKLEFLEIPKNTGIKYTCVSAKDLDILDTEVRELVQKEAVEYVPLNEIENGFYSTFFLVPKKTGDMRPVINLKTPQQVSPKTTFQNGFPFYGSQSGETRRLGNQSGLKGRIFTRPNLQNAQEISEVLSKKRESSSVQGSTFRSNLSPRVFTKIVAVVAAHLRSRGIRLVVYLDDWFLLNQEKSQLILDRELVLNLLVELGFIINLKKSTLDPSQQITYLGAMFLLDLGIVLPTVERTSKINNFIPGNDPSKSSNSQRFSSPSRDNVILLRNNSQCKITHETCSNTSVENFGNQFLRNLEFKVPITAHLRSHLKWWLDQTNIKKGRSLKHWETHATMTTDASTSVGWGGHMGTQIAQGTWNLSRKNSISTA